VCVCVCVYGCVCVCVFVSIPLGTYIQEIYSILKAIFCDMFCSTMNELARNKQLRHNINLLCSQFIFGNE
jgi:hypothetical protein